MTEQLWQTQDLEQQEKRFYEIAGRLHSLVMIGALDTNDFEEILYSFGILSDWKKSEDRERDCKA